jgi:cellulose synthase/poly-beta-1,6-N-acetylglucosamine synthase-like glycosyltransferase
LTAFAFSLVAFPVAVAIYAYIGYPLILWIASLKRERETIMHYSDWPFVSVVIPAYNEEKQIAGAIDALLAQDYAKERLQILILSDASTDATDKIVRQYESRGVELLRMPRRGGKTMAENMAISRLRGEIIVNSDSSIRLHSSAVRELVAHMADPTVGVTSGRDVSISRDNAANITEAGYVNYEMRVRVLETLTGGIIGASGSCYAIRAELHKIPVRNDLSRDFSAALTARIHGFRSLSVERAICFVPRTSALREEYRRKVRTISRGMETLYVHRSLLDPVRYGAFAWKLFSHKVCRWLLPLLIVPGMFGLVLLASSHSWARVLLAVGAVFALLAVIGTVWPSERRAPRIVSLPAFAVAANLAVLVALWRLLARHQDHIWEPTRR